MTRAESDLLSFGEILINIAVELQLSNVADRYILLGPHFSGIEDVEVEFVLVLRFGQNLHRYRLVRPPAILSERCLGTLISWQTTASLDVTYLVRDALNAKLPFGVGLVVDGFIQILAMKIWILSGKLQCFIPDQRMDTELRSEMKLHEMAFPFCIDQRVGVDSEALHHPVRSRDAPVRHGPVIHVRCLFMHLASTSIPGKAPRGVYIRRQNPRSCYEHSELAGPRYLAQA